MSSDKLNLILAVKGNKRKFSHLKLLFLHANFFIVAHPVHIFHRLYFFSFSFVQALPTVHLLPTLCSICNNKTSPYILFLINLIGMHCKLEGVRLFIWITLLHMKTIAPKLMCGSLVQSWPSGTYLLYLSSPPPCLHLCSPSRVQTVTARWLSRWQSGGAWWSKCLCILVA